MTIEEIKERYFSEFINIKGDIAEKNPFNYPYSFDKYIQWISEDYNQSHDGILYSDRMYEWNSQKFNKYCNEVWNNSGQNFDYRTPEEIEKFLKLYINCDIVLDCVEKVAHLGNGFPIWIFYFHQKRNNEELSEDITKKYKLNTFDFSRGERNYKRELI